MNHLTYFVGGILFSLFVPLESECQNWQPLSAGVVNGSVYSLFEDTVEESLYVGGDFERIGGNNTQRAMAMWKENQWFSLDNGLNSYQWPASVRDIVRYNDEIYVCGSITDANGVSCNGIARWNGIQWLPVGSGLLDIDGNPGFAFNLSVINDELYVCGRFITAGGISANGIAKWNGTSWLSVHDFPFFDLDGDVITDCIIYNDELYVAGSFNGGSSNGMLGITKWNGSNWVGVGSVGVGQTTCLAVYQGKLYAAGVFNASMNPIFPGYHIASWDGTSWDNVGGGLDTLNGDVHEMIVHNGKLFVVGWFKEAGGIPAEYIATWDGQEWCNLGSSSNNKILAIEAFEDTIYIGGGFTELNGSELMSIAKSGGSPQDENCGTLAGVTEECSDNDSPISVFPNPTNGMLNVMIHGVKGPLTLGLYDAVGQKVLAKQINVASEGQRQTLDLGQLSNGLYVLTCTSENAPIASIKVIIQ